MKPQIYDESEYTVLGFEISKYRALTIRISKSKGAYPDAAMFAHFDSSYQWGCDDYIVGEQNIDDAIKNVVNEAQHFLKLRWNKPEYKDIKWWDTEEEAYKNALITKPIKRMARLAKRREEDT